MFRRDAKASTVTFSPIPKKTCIENRISDLEHHHGNGNDDTSTLFPPSVWSGSIRTMQVVIFYR